MSGSLTGTQTYGFADGNGGHSCVFSGGAPAAGALDVLCVNSDTTVSTPSGFTVNPSFVNSQGAYLFFRFAAGGEGAAVTVTTTGNFDTQVTWLRFSGLLSLDVTAVSHVDGSGGTSTPAVDTGALAQTGETVVAFAALHGTGAGTAVTPVWSSGYTEADGTSQGQVQSFVGYRTDSGSDETPQVSWTNNVADRYMLVATFIPASTTEITLGAAAETDAASSLVTSEQIALGRAGETDVATTLATSEVVALGRAGETDAAANLSIVSLVTLTVATEVDAVTTLIITETIILGRASELDQARTLTISGQGTGGCFTFGAPSLDWRFGDPVLCPLGGCCEC